LINAALNDKSRMTEAVELAEMLGREVIGTSVVSA